MQIAKVDASFISVHTYLCIILSHRASIQTN